MSFLLFAIVFSLPLLMSKCKIKKIKNNTIRKLADNFVESVIQFKKKPRLIGQSLLLGVIFQLLCSVVIWLLANNLGMSLRFIEIFWISSVLSIAIFLPISIAGIGVREGTLIGLLGLFSISNDKAMALSLLLFAVQISGGIIGAIFEILDNKH
jgi:hypothetical protein